MTNDCRGLAVTDATPEMVAALEECHLQALAFYGDPVASCDLILREHPQFIMALCFKGAMLSQAMETRIYNDFVETVRRAEALSDKANTRELGHIAALRSWLDGDFHGAVQKWEEVATAYPFDLLAIQLVHLSDTLLGDIVGQRDSVARAFPLWDESVPGFEFILGFYSFGLEENNDYYRAGQMANQALSIRPDHPYAIHAVSHIMEMQGKAAAGVKFMNKRRASWADSNFKIHLHWHTSLYHLDRNDTGEALALYDQHLSSDDVEGEKYEELDAAALMWRLNLVGVDVGDRWKHLADKWIPSATDTLYAFNDVHAMMCFVADGRSDVAEKLLNANERYLGHANDANTAMSRIIGLPFCRALSAFAKEDYDYCVDLLLPRRYQTHRLGGSFAQRDVIGWTLLEAALRSKRYDLALALANERCSLKPTSPMNWQLVARAHEGRGDKSRASQARDKMSELLVA